MKTFLNRRAAFTDVEAIMCNQCGQDIVRDRFGYFQDYLAIEKGWGYHSPYDGEVHSMDICQDCYKQWVAGFKIPPQVEYVEYMWG